MEMDTVQVEQFWKAEAQLLLEKNDQLEKETLALGRDLDRALDAIKVAKTIIKHQENAAFTHFGKKVIGELLYSVLNYDRNPLDQFDDIPF